MIHIKSPLFNFCYSARRDVRQSAVAAFDCALCSIHSTRI